MKNKKNPLGQELVAALKEANQYHYGRQVRGGVVTIFEYVLVKKDEHERILEAANKRQRLVSFGYWFSALPGYELLEKFMRDEVHNVSVEAIRSEYARSHGLTVYGEPLKQEELKKCNCGKH